MKSNLLSIGQLIDHSWHYYRKHFTELMSISGWLIITAIISTLGFTLFPSASAILSERSFTFTESFGNVLLFINGIVVAPLMGIWIFNGLARMIHTQVNNRTTTIKQVLLFSNKYFLPAVVVSIIYGAIMLSTLLFFIPGIIVMGYSASSSALGLLGSLLLVIALVAAGILAVLWGIRFFFAPFSLIIDGHKGMSAIRHSRDLVKGQFWPIFWRLIIPRVLYGVIFFIVFFALSQMFDVIISGTAGLNIDLQVRLDTIISSILSVVAAIIFQPIMTVTDYLIYKDLRK